jgi:hypothetical protein
MFACATKTVWRFIMGHSPVATVTARLSKNVQVGIAQDFSTRVKMLVQKSNQQRQQKET